MLRLITHFIRSHQPPRGGRRRVSACMPALLAAFVLPASAVPVTIDTSSVTGHSALFSITLIDGDLVAPNNTADISNFMTDAMPPSSIGCTNGCSFHLSDFGEFTQNFSALGTSISFDLTFTHAVDHTNPLASSDLVIGELLGLSNFHTNLNDPSAPVPFQDAVFVANLAANSLIVGTAVPVPGALALFASGVALLGRRSLRSTRQPNSPVGR